MPGTAFTRLTAAAATATFAASLAATAPAHAGQGDPGPGGPTRFDIAFSGAKCDYATDQVVVTMTITQDPAYSSWQYVGAYYNLHQNGGGWDFYDVSDDTAITGGWIGPGSAPLTVSFAVAPPTSNEWLEVDDIDLYPADGYYTDMSIVTPTTCRFLIPIPFPLPHPVTLTQF